MPPKKRSEVWRGFRHEDLPGAVVTAAAAPTQEARHLRCPTCSLMAREDLIRGGPYTPYVRMQRYGGTVASPTGRRRGMVGVMIWEPPEPTTDEDIEDLARNLRAGLVILGEKEVP